MKRIPLSQRRFVLQLANPCINRQTLSWRCSVKHTSLGHFDTWCQWRQEEARFVSFYFIDLSAIFNA